MNRFVLITWFSERFTLLNIWYNIHSYSFYPYIPYRYSFLFMNKSFDLRKSLFGIFLKYLYLLIFRLNPLKGHLIPNIFRFSPKHFWLCFSISKVNMWFLVLVFVKIFLLIYFILTKVTFCINHMNLSKTKDLHAWIFWYHFLSYSLYPHIPCRYKIFQQFTWIAYCN